MSETKALFKHPEAILNTPTNFCPGCGHGIIHRLIADVIDDMNIREKTIGIVGVGCSSRSWTLFNFDFLAVPHGRCGANGTAVKRSLPDNYVFTYSGDGDAYAIGISGYLWSAIRGEKFTAIVVNNSIFAMTGGQLAPTSLDGQVTVTSPEGRNIGLTGAPLHFPELLAGVPGTAYSARVSVDSVPNIRKAGQAIARAMEKQKNKAGFSLVEILAPCPTGMNMKAPEAAKWVKDSLQKEYPLGVFVDK